MVALTRVHQIKVPLRYTIPSYKGTSILYINVYARGAYKPLWNCNKICYVAHAVY